MEEQASSLTTAAPRKVRFRPKVPTHKTPKSAENKIEGLEDTEAAQTRELLRRVNEGSGRRGPKVERKSAPVQVAFGHGGGSSSIRSFGRTSNSRSGSGPQSPVFDDGPNAADEKKKKEYVEPWDYYSYYPVTLPLRRPYSGNPELLDEKEFGEASANLDYDESYINPAAELGLMEESEEARMFFLQLPASLPLVKRSASVKGKEKVDSLKPSRDMRPPEKGCSLEELPAGLMGKMMVYRSGAIKLKLGETLYDVSPGSDCVFAQDVAAINTEDKHCCILGELNKRAIVTPDVDSLVNSVIDLG